MININKGRRQKERRMIMAILKRENLEVDK